MTRMKLLAATASVCALAAGAAFAQDGGQAPNDGGATLDEIVVTAQKREQTLQDVPISVAVVSAEVLQEQGVQKLQDLQTKVPNFSMTETGIGTNIAVRGIFSGVNQGFEQSVGMYVDGIHYGRAQQTRSPFLDVQRVEVLRGPQSILFGKNAIAGAMNIVSAEPSFNPTGSLSVAYDPEHNDTETVGMLSGPLNEKMRVRLAGRYHEGDGYIHNATLDRDEPERLDWNVRGTVAIDVTDNLEVTIKAEKGRFNVNGRNMEIFGETPSTSANPAFAGKTYDQILTFIGNLSPTDAVVVDPSVSNITRDGIRSSNGDLSRNDTQNYVLTANWETKLGTLTAISGLSKFAYNEVCDCDFTGAVVFNAALQEDYRQVSHELRLVSPTGGKFDYIVGGFYQSSEHAYADQINVPLDSVLVPVINMSNPGAGTLLAGTRASRQASVDAKVQSAFAQGTWHVTDDLRFTVGGRITKEQKDGDRTLTIQKLDGTALAGTQAIVAPIVYANAFKVSSANLTTIASMGVPTYSAQAAGLAALLGTHPVSGVIDDTTFTPSVNVQYDVNDDIMLYATWAKGSKSGGFDFRGNNRGFYSSMADAFEFSDEKATTYEVGSKMRLLGGRAELNGAVYYTDMQDLQVSVFDGVLGFVVGNADARTYGLEADGRFAVTDNLTARASFSLTDFEFTDHKMGQCYPGQTTDVINPVTQQCDYTGKTNQLVADWQGALALDYERPITGDLEFRGSIDVAANAGYNASAQLDPAQVQEAFAMANLRLALGDSAGRWELAVLGKNLTDEQVLQFGGPTPLAYNTFKANSHYNLVGQGRTVTLQARVKF
ncbi:TonB-dependent receptor [Caulobacter sp. 17J80-11]|uniref:TonB-dependent receptor n=1 Tax=Caulobacter sp. 17J80-11 TaxID=2763502 RepID=UPI0016539BEA|nr:TonB-dependent receptor [Caulobacter sp. 17J80-11]MBC6980360.1 TonB-dependent receptor [Caulobacter sp. 17J80-11]